MQNQFIYPLRVHIEDTDVTGVAYHGSYLNFLERARSEWLIQLGMGINWQRENGIVFVVHSLSIQYLKPAKIHEQVEVVSSINNVRSASCVFDQYVRLAANPDQILCKAEVKVACVDNEMRVAPIPSSVLKSL